MAQASVTLRRYTPEDEPLLFALLCQEGEEWKDYWQDEGWAKYRRAMANSMGYLVLKQEALCGYLRCRDDDGYGLYIYDLLVDKNHRGKGYGRLLMEQVCRDYPGSTVYVMSDVNPYYESLGYAIEGSIFIVAPSS